MSGSSARRIVIEFLGEDKSASKVAGQVDSRTSKLGSTLGKVGKVAALGLAAGIGAGAIAMVGMTKNAIEDEAAQRKLATGLRNAVGATDAQVASVENYISKTSIAKGVTDDELRPAFQRLVESTGSITKAQKEMDIALDVSAGTGKSLKTVSEALMKANNGSTASLSKLGLKTKDAEGNTLSLKDAMKSMSDTFKGQAEAKANSLEGKMTRLGIIFDETKETIGGYLIPVLYNLADVFIKDVVPALAKTGAWIRDNLFPVIRQIASVVGEWIGKAAAYVREHMDDIKATIRNVLMAVRIIWAQYGDEILQYLRGVWKVISGVVRGALLVIRGIIKVFTGIFKGDWRMVWEGIKDILRGVWSAIKGIVTGGLDILKALMRGAWGVLKSIVRGAWEVIKGLVSDGVSRLLELVRGVPDKIGGLASKMVKAGKDFIGGLWDGVLAGAKNAGGFISNLIGSIKDAINDALDLPLEINFDKGPVHIHATLIPALAKGGTAIQSGMALVGERGPELVDLPRGASVIPLRGRVGRGGGAAAGQGDGDLAMLTVNLNLDGRSVQQVLLKVKRENGGLLLGLA